MGVEELYRRAKRTAEYMGYDSEAQDIAQEVMIKFLVKGKGQTIDQAIIDVLRRMYGNMRLKSLKAKQRFNNPRDLNLLHDELPSKILSEETFNSQIDFERILNLFDGKDRAMLCLKYYWGLTDDEVGHCFGVNGSRVSQCMKDIHKHIKAVIVTKKTKRQKKDTRSIKKLR